MDADLDLLLTTVFCTADDLLPESKSNARRRVTDAEVVTLCVAQTIMGIPSGKVPGGRRQATGAYFKRHRRLTEASEWLMGNFASQSPGFADDLLRINSTRMAGA